MVPSDEFPPLTPSTDHVTTGLFAPTTVAVNCWVPPRLKPTEVGDIAMLPCTVTVAVALLVPSATLVAVIVCVPESCGAVYRPAAVIDPVVVFPIPAESIAQMTFWLLEPATAAVNCCCAPGLSVRDDGSNVTDTGPPEFVDGGPCRAAHPTDGARVASRRIPLKKVDSVTPIQRVSR